LLESFRDPEVVQHRIFSVLIAAFGIFEWCVRTGRLKSVGASYVFPLMTAVGAVLLLTHSHALNNVREELLIEWTHIPLAIFGVAAGWARWLELRLDPADRKIPSWIWPICLIMVGVILLIYREH
jgi:putative copper resistance protein D